MAIRKSHVFPAFQAGITLVLLFLLQVIILPAQQADSQEEQPVYKLDEVTVTATRTETDTLDVPQQVTVITAAQIAKSGATDLAGLLANCTGTVVRSYGEEGSLKSVSLRGSTQEQVLVLIDGVRQNDARSGGTAIQQIALGNVERIEIIHGSMSMIYGSDAVGGVVNIITKKKIQPDEHLQLSLTSSGYMPWQYATGSGESKQLLDPDFYQLIDAQNVGLLAAAELGGVHIRFYNSFTNAANAFLYQDTEQSYRQREHAGYLADEGTLSLYWPGKDRSLHLTLSGFYDNKNVPGSLTYPSTEAVENDSRLAGQLHYTQDSFLNNSDLNLNWNLYYTMINLAYQNPAWSVDSHHTTQQLGGDFVQEYSGSELFSLIYGGNLLADLVQSTDLNYQWRASGGLFLVAPFYLTSFFTLQPAVRLDYYSELRWVINGSLGAVWRLTNATALKANLATAFRAPTFNDLYWPYDGMQEGNPNLKPETSYNFEVGVSTRHTNLQGDIFGFVRYTDNYILWQSGSDFIWRPSNWAALCPGLEAHLSSTFWDVLTLSADYTFLFTFDLTKGYTLDDNRRLPYIPVHDIGAGITYEANQHLVSLKAKVQSSRLYGTDKYLEPYLLLNLNYQYTFDAHWQASAALDNLLNTSYQLQPGYPMPLLTFRLGLTFKA